MLDTSSKRCSRGIVSGLFDVIQVTSNDTMASRVDKSTERTNPFKPLKWWAPDTMMILLTRKSFLRWTSKFAVGSNKETSSEITRTVSVCPFANQYAPGIWFCSWCPSITIPEFTKERYLSRVAKARALVPLREKFAHFLFSSYLFFYFIFHLLCYISVSHKVCSFQWCQKFDMLYWEIKIGSQNGDSEWLCKSQPYLRVQNL